jgi:hypothetical protein
MDWETLKQYKLCLDDGDVGGAARVIAAELRKLPATPFHRALDLDVTNSADDAAAYFDAGIAAANEIEPTRAAAIELNGFTVNTQLWHCGLSAFPEDFGTDDLAWVGDAWHWSAGRFLAIEGLEPLQLVFAEHRGLRDDEVRSEARTLAGSLVIVKFFGLAQAAAARMKHRGFPIYALTHDDDDVLVIPA